MKNGKLLKRIGIAIVLTFPFVFIYFSFANSKDCSQLVIDTYEIHSGINIPKVDFINCHYDEDQNVRISVYTLRNESEISLSSFTTTDLVPGINALSGSSLLEFAERPVSQNLHIASGEKWGRTWTYIYEAETRRLWAELAY